MILRSKALAPVVLFAVLLVAAQTLSAQNTTATDPKDEKKAASIATDSKEKKPAPAVNPLVPSKDGKTVAVTAEQVAESTIFIYGLGGGRATLNQIRKTTIERGKISVTSAEGRVDQASYSRWIQRAETLNKEKVRLDQEFPNARYSLVFNEEKIFGVVDDSIFTPREDASKAFENQIVHGLESLLRYKENESKIEYVSKEKVLGVEFHILDVIDKQSRKTRFYISAKTFRVMMLDYEQDGTKYRRKFYDYNYAQGTLVPYRSALFAGDKLVEETEVGTVSFGQKIDENMFRAG